MNEAFLHFIWENQLFETENLKTDTGKTVQIVSRGYHNSDAGPDFFNAKIKIGEQVWAGNVEIHLKSSDWKKHNHHTNKAYNSVVLQAVLQNDQKTFRTTGEQIPTIELDFDEKLLVNYQNLNNAKQTPACFSQISYLDKFTVKHWLSRLQVERLEQKSTQVLKLLEMYKNSWEEAFYIHLAKNFGFKKNAEPFELLAKSLPLKHLAKHKNNLLQIEAMLFGQAGMLDKEIDSQHYKNLQTEYKFLQNKFQLQKIDEHLWIFLRLRPSNFPTIRIAQFARLVHKSSNLFSKILEFDDVEKIRQLFEVEADGFWKNHYNFDKESKPRSKKLGTSAIDNILINTVSLFLFVYGQKKNSEEHKNQAIRLLETIKPENNSIIKNWQQAGINAENAFYSQALIQLNNQYCKPQRCLKCQIGSKLVSKLKF